MSGIRERDAIVIGGGPAGLAAALELKRQGIDDILVIEREDRPGGILRQCIHDGFGLTRFGESMSGPEYAERFAAGVREAGIECLTGAMVTNLDGDRVATVASRSGVAEYRGRAVVLAMGCRERARGAIGIPGDRPAGVYTAGVAQAYVNLHNRMVGKRIVILGSGDIGLIMARRLTLEGADVLGVFEIMPYASGLPRNVEQCLNDYGIPLYTSHTVTRVTGRTRVESVAVAPLGPGGVPDAAREWIIACDCLVLSVGLIPENELSRKAGVELNPRTGGPLIDENFETGVPGVFAAGNALHVHDLVDFVSLEAEAMAAAAARHIRGEMPERRVVNIACGDGIGHIVPNRIGGGRNVDVAFRVSRPATDAKVVAMQGGREVAVVGRKRMIPAEMLVLSLKADRLDASGDVTVALI